MPARDPHLLVNRINELEAENRRLREQVSWAAMRLRQCAATAIDAIGDLEFAVMSDPDALGAVG